MDTDYADDLALCTNTLARSEFLLHSLEQEAGDIGFYENANKTKYMCFNRDGAILTLSGGPLKFVDNFTYFGCHVSSTESDVSICQSNSPAIDWLSIISKSYLSDKIKRDFFQAADVSIQLNGYSTLTLTKRWEKKLDEEC